MRTSRRWRSDPRRRQRSPTRGRAQRPQGAGGWGARSAGTIPPLCRSGRCQPSCRRCPLPRQQPQGPPLPLPPLWRPWSHLKDLRQPTLLPARPCLPRRPRGAHRVHHLRRPLRRHPHPGAARGSAGRPPPPEAPPNPHPLPPAGPRSTPVTPPPGCTVRCRTSPTFPSTCQCPCKGRCHGIDCPPEERDQPTTPRRRRAAAQPRTPRPDRRQVAMPFAAPPPPLPEPNPEQLDLFGDAP